MFKISDLIQIKGSNLIWSNKKNRDGFQIEAWKNQPRMKNQFEATCRGTWLQTGFSFGWVFLSYLTELCSVYGHVWRKKNISDLYCTIVLKREQCEDTDYSHFLHNFHVPTQSNNAKQRYFVFIERTCSRSLFGKKKWGLLKICYSAGIGTGILPSAGLVMRV